MLNRIRKLCRSATIVFTLILLTSAAISVRAGEPITVGGGGGSPCGDPITVGGGGGNCATGDPITVGGGGGGFAEEGSPITVGGGGGSAFLIGLALSLIG